MASHRITVKQRYEASEKLRAAFDAIPGRADKQHARALDWRPDIMSKTVNGRRVPTEDELLRIDTYLTESTSNGYQPGEIYLWYTPGLADELPHLANDGPESKTSRSIAWVLGAAVTVGVALVASPSSCSHLQWVHANTNLARHPHPISSATGQRSSSA